MDTVCIDFDGTLRADDGSPIPGGATALGELKRAGYEVVIWTAISAQDELARVHDWLVDHGIPFDQIVSNRKPPAVAYVDNRAITFKGDWAPIVEQLLSKRVPSRQATSRQATLHMLIGLPGSGKSSLAEASRALVVSHDKMHHLLARHDLADAAERALVEHALSRGEDVVLDRLNLTVAHRAAWIALAHRLGARVHGFFFRLGLERQWRGNLERRESKRVDLDDFQSIASAFQEPTSAEGFDELRDVIEDEYGVRELRRNLG